MDGGSPIVIRNEDIIQLAGIDEAEFKSVCDTELAGIERRRQRYLSQGGNNPRSLACHAFTTAKKLVLAVPVAPTDTIGSMQEESGEVVCLEDHEIFGAIGYFMTTSVRRQTRR